MAEERLSGLAFPERLSRATAPSDDIKARGSPSRKPSVAKRVLFLPKAKGVGEEVRGRLSGHGFSTVRREERRRMRSEFPRWGNERADEPIPEPARREKPEWSSAVTNPEGNYFPLFR